MRMKSRVPTLILSLTACVLIRVGAAVVPATAPTVVSIGGKPVHPLVLAALIGDLASERPTAAAVDLDDRVTRRVADTKPEIDGRNVVVRDGERGYIAYRHLGVTSKGTHVFIVMVCGGGSGVFETVLWVGLGRDQVWEDGARRDRTLLVKRGTFVLGDRDTGTVELDGDDLRLGKSQYRAEAMRISFE